MNNSFDEILDSVETLTIEDKFSIAEIIKNRAIEERRLEIKKNAEQAHIEFLAENIKSMTVDEFMKEIED